MSSPGGIAEVGLRGARRWANDGRQRADPLWTFLPAIPVCSDAQLNTASTLRRSIAIILNLNKRISWEFGIGSMETNRINHSARCEQTGGFYALKKNLMVPLRLSPI